MSWEALAADATALLTGWRAPDEQQETWRRQYLDALAGARAASAPAGALSRDGAPAHLTASCLVVDAAWTRTLLVLHRKGGVWVQPGGHVEAGDASLAAAAAREVAEETGLALDPAAAPADLSRHGLGSAFGRCAEHLDVTFWAVAPPQGAPVVSDESDAVAWWPLDALPEGVVADLPGRLAALSRRLGPPSPAGRPSRPTATP